MDLTIQPWPWWVSGVLIGLTVPLMVLLAGKPFGISTSFQHLGAIVRRHSQLPYFRNYDRRAGRWRLFFVAGIAMGGFLGAHLLSRETIEFLPAQFSTMGGMLQLIAGGFCIGFGARYAGGCTSGHAITGISNLNGPSMVATLCFFAGGVATTWGMGFFFS